MFDSMSYLEPDIHIRFLDPTSAMGVGNVLTNFAKKI